MMPGLDYPFVYECSNCDRETTDERARTFAQKYGLNQVKAERGGPRKAKHLHSQQLQSTEKEILYPVRSEVEARTGKVPELRT